MEALGIDIGGSGIKGAPVDLESGGLLSPRYRIPTPNPSTPKAVAKTISKITTHFEWKGSVGCGFPAVVVQGTTYTAANVHSNWVNTNAQSLFSEKSNCETTLTCKKQVRVKIPVQ